MQQTKLAALKALQTRIHTTATLTSAEPWFFPSESIVQGFYGTDPIILVGQRPSPDKWDETHRHRRALYDGLAEIGAGNIHLTDLYKYRGSVESVLPLDSLPDFALHLAWLKEEIAILSPLDTVYIIAMGNEVHKLLRKHLENYRQGIFLEKVMHFGALRWGKTPTDLRDSMVGVITWAYECLHDDGRM